MTLTYYLRHVFTLCVHVFVCLSVIYQQLISIWSSAKLHKYQSMLTSFFSGNMIYQKSCVVNRRSHQKISKPKRWCRGRRQSPRSNFVSSGLSNSLACRLNWLHISSLLVLTMSFFLWALDKIPVFFHDSWKILWLFFPDPLTKFAFLKRSFDNTFIIPCNLWTKRVFFSANFALFFWQFVSISWSLDKICFISRIFDEIHVSSEILWQNLHFFAFL